MSQLRRRTSQRVFRISRPERKDSEGCCEVPASGWPQPRCRSSDGRFWKPHRKREDEADMVAVVPGQVQTLPPVRGEPPAPPLACALCVDTAVDGVSGFRSPPRCLISTFAAVCPPPAAWVLWQARVVTMTREPVLLLQAAPHRLPRKICFFIVVKIIVQLCHTLFCVS